jgi:hypothetical protein
LQLPASEPEPWRSRLDDGGYRVQQCRFGRSAPRCFPDDPNKSLAFFI